jgi:hypothetical protein
MVHSHAKEENGISRLTTFMSVVHSAIIRRHNKREGLMRAFFVGFLLLAAGPALAAEKYVGSNTDVRTVLAFKAADAAVQKFLPEGWELDVATSGPTKDINLRVTFIDRLSAQDADGKALPAVRTVTLSVPAKKKGSEARGTMLFGI